MPAFYISWKSVIPMFRYASWKILTRMLLHFQSKAASGPKHTSLLPYITSYLPPKNQDHSMSRSKDTKNQSSTAVPRLHTRGPTLTFVFPSPTYISNIITIHLEVLELWWQQISGHTDRHKKKLYLHFSWSRGNKNTYSLRPCRSDLLQYTVITSWKEGHMLTWQGVLKLSEFVLLAAWHVSHDRFGR